MKHRDRLRLALVLGCLFSSNVGHAGNWRRDAGSPAQPPRFVVYYGTSDDAALYDYNIVVLDSDIDGAIVRRFGHGCLLLGYLSLGEVHKGRAYATELDRQGLLLSHNQNWSDARFIDLRDARWKQRVLDELVPAILTRGFGGLFLDTLDDAGFLETSDPVRYAGMTDSAVDLVLAIWQRFPQLPIMVNRGYALLPRIASGIDMLLGESVHSTYDANARNYVRVSPEAMRWQRDRLNDARRIRPSLRLFSLDYWSAADPPGIARIYAEAQANGFVPYVATIDLSKIIPRP